eukprot:maker-scaffold_74-snap-gene-0.19-mRNA-1 protein AED:0.00 eAED:0.00 QI:142/1/1/1/1/1/2/77/153
MNTFMLDGESFLVPFDFFSPAVPPPQKSLKSYEERKDEIIGKIHVLPLKTFHTKETLENWSKAKLFKQLKLNGDESKYSPDKGDLVNFVYNFGNQNTSCNDSCGICVEDYENKDIIRLLGCEHAFHVDCIDRWAINSAQKSTPPKCPMCNAQI